MNKLFTTVSILAVAISTSSLNYKTGNANGFKIIGSTTGFPDSTQIFLGDISNTAFIDIDSAYIIHGQFQFSGSLKEKVIHVAIRTKDYSDIKNVWLENTVITVKGEKGKFREAVVYGSKTQNKQDILDSLFNLAGDEKNQSIVFIRGHPYSIISADLLDIYGTSWGKDTSTILYNSISKEIKNTIYGRNVLEFITLNKNLKIGDRYIDFSQPNIHGINIKLSDYTGKVVLLEFWGSWCIPCRQGNPEMLKIYSEFKNRGFEILGIAAEMVKKDWIEAVQQDSLIWQNVTDFRLDKNRAALIYGVSSYPTNFLIDKTGTIVGKNLTGDKLRQKLMILLR